MPIDLEYTFYRNFFYGINFVLTAGKKEIR